jgi:NAD(P)-dependent dehydrogenase (short-subunit alcohol dehydrogenase family)
MAQTILITGSNAGFGRLMARTLAARGHTVYAGMRGVAGRNAAAAQELRGFTGEGGGAIRPIELDPGSDASVDSAIEAVLEETGGSLDAVVNNAGFGTVGLTEGFTSRQVAELFEVNVIGPQRVSRAVLPAMRSRGAGLLVFISSGIGRLVLPAMGIYCASKFALEALAEGYSYELAPVGIDVAIVQPGAYPTGFLDGSKGPADPERAAGYGPLANLPEQLAAGLRHMFSQATAPDPQQVADAVATLVDAPAGKRPLRTPVDASGAEGVKAINAVCAQVQAGMLGAMGMGGLVRGSGSAT